MDSKDHRKWMQRAVDLARSSIAEAGRIDFPPAVGVVIVKDGVEVTSSFRGQCAEGAHAEFCALKDVGPELARGATVYTTLEPCSRRNAPKISCAQHLIGSDVAAVFIGMYDPNPKIYREGWRMLRDAGIGLYDFPRDLRIELQRLNRAFVDQYHAARASSGAAIFDYVRNGTFMLGEAPDNVETRWSTAGSGSIHAVSNGACIALARHAETIAEIDDPSAMDFSPHVYTVHARAGDVVVFRGRDVDTYAIVRVNAVLCSPNDDRSELSLSFEIRKAGSRLDE